MGINKNFKKIAFGTYRIFENPLHREALTEALQGGINLIDTSSTYTNGSSERLIGKVLEELKDELPRDEVTIVSKFGYIHGDNMKRYREGFQTPDTVPCSSSYHHCVHPDFMRDQLNRSLERLKTDYVDVYLLHNPEYYLTHNVKEETTKEELEIFRKEMYRRIGLAFLALEEEVEKGRIRSYGISSNSFSLPLDHPHFLPFEGLISLAEEAAQKAGREKHSFSTIQFPGNLLEQEGLKNCAPWAKKNNLSVLINRPLNAIVDNRLIRLSEDKKPEDYEEVLAEVIKTFKDGGIEVMVKLTEETDAMKDKFESIGQYEESLFTGPIPYFREASLHLDHQQVALINRFIRTWSLEARHYISAKTKAILKEKGIETELPLQEYAIRFLMDSPGVSSVLLGMKRPDYVEQAFEILDK